MSSPANRFRLSPPAWLALSGVLMLAGMVLAALYPDADAARVAAVRAQAFDRPVHVAAYTGWPDNVASRACLAQTSASCH